MRPVALVVAASAIGLLASSSAYAGPLINVGACSPEPCVVSTNLAGFVPGFPAITFGPDTVGAFSINGSASVPVNGELISNAISVSTTTGGTIIIDVSGTGATGLGPGTTLQSSFTSNLQQAGTTHTVTERTFFDSANGLFNQFSTTPGNELSSATLTSATPETAGPFSVVLDTTLGAVSVADEYDITLTGCSVSNPCQANLTIDLLAAAASVPEPGTLGILGTALAMLGMIWMSRRRSWSHFSA